MRGRAHVGGRGEAEPELADAQLHAAGVGRRRRERQVLLQVVGLHPLVLQGTQRQKRFAQAR